MTRRERNLATLKKLGFKVAASLPTVRGDERVRPASEIAARFRALRELFRQIHAMPRAKARSVHQGTIGWRLENMWPLAWILGFEPIAGTGVIHERRHALTWATSPRVKWDDTDLST